MTDEQIKALADGIAQLMEACKELGEAIAKMVTDFFERLKPLIPYIRYWNVKQRVLQPVYQRSFQLQILKLAYPKDE